VALDARTRAAADMKGSTKDAKADDKKPTAK
jgi:hypothetical protein